MTTDVHALASVATLSPTAARGRRWVLFVVGVHTLGMVLAYVVLVATAGGRALEDRVLPSGNVRAGHEQDAWLVGPSRQLLEAFGDRVRIAVALAVLLLLALVLRRLRAGVVGVAAAVGSGLAAEGLKELLARPDVDVAGVGGPNSFPSGNVAVAAGLVVALLFVLPAGVRLWFALPGAALIAAIGTATVMAGWHRPSDVIGGVLLAGILQLIGAAVLRRGLGGGVVSVAALPFGLGVVLVVLLSGAGLTAVLVATAVFVVCAVVSVTLALPGWSHRLTSSTRQVVCSASARRRPHQGDGDPT